MDRQIARAIRCKIAARTVLLASSILAGGLAQTAQAGTLPVGGTVAAGTAAIATSGATTTISQSSARAVIDWTSFSVGQGNSVVFNQPGTQSATLNRVTGSATSTIAGQIRSNGAVYLVNPNGIAITSTGVVQTAGGFVASTLNIADADFMAGKLNFVGTGSSAGVTNGGTITAGKGAYVALLGGQIANSGTIAVPLGSVGLGSGEQIALDINGGNFLQVAVPTSALSGSNALISNAGAITAGGGTVILSAATLKSLVRNVINLSGSINADSAVGNGGTIELLGGEGGTVVAGGSLSARATGATGNGGSIETSGQTVNANGLTVNTTAANGTVGTWKIDPASFTIAASGGDITGAQLSANLANSNVSILSSSGAAGTTGDVTVGDTISWSSGNTLSLSAYRNINFNTSLSATGANAGLVLQADNTGTGTGTVIFASGVQANLTGAGSFANVYYNAPTFATPVNFASTTNASNVTTGITAGTLIAYELVNNLTELQNINKNLTDNYALGTNIDATATATENSNAGFIPLGTNGAGTITGSGFTGNFDGLGHTITNLTIARSSRAYVGLFGFVSGGSSATIKNVSLVNVKIAGNQYVGGLVGYDGSGQYANSGGETFTNDSVSGTVTGSNAGTTAANSIGGLIGFNYVGGTLSQLTSSATVTGSSTSSYVGGLIGALNASGYVTGTLTNAGATGAVSGGTSVGGLVGSADSTTLTNVSASGNVTGAATSNSANSVGGLIGSAQSTTITTASATGTVTATGYTSDVGGLIGYAVYSTLTTVSAAGNVTGNSTSNATYAIGGLIGYSSGNTITGASAIGTVAAAGNANYLGGLIGEGNSDTVTNAYATGTVTGYYDLGGLIGYSSSETIATAYATGNVIGSTYAVSGTTYGPTYIGGLVGYIYNGSITGSYATGAVSGNQYVGGLVGYASSVPVTSSYATGNVTGTSYTLSAAVYAAGSVGGLVGTASFGDINSAWASGTVSAVGASTSVGGLAGSVYGSNVNNSYATGNVTGGSGSSSIGGLIGSNNSNGYQVTYSYATGSVTGSTIVGGLLGGNGASVISSYAIGAVAQVGTASTSTTTNSYSNIGGLIGNNTGNVTQSYANGNVTVASAKYNVTSVGGLMGSNSGQVTQSYATGTVNAGTSSNNVGGLDGYDNGSILQSWATGAVTGANSTGGLAGFATSIYQSWASGAVTGLGTVSSGSVYGTGGLVGYAQGTIYGSYATGNVTETASGVYAIGGLVGYNYANITQSYATGAVMAGAANYYVGGLVGYNAGGNLTQTYATGGVTAGAGSTQVGGLVGSDNSGSITQSYATGAVVATSATNSKGVVTTPSSYLGGLVGYDGNGAITQSFATGNVTGDNGSNNVGGLVGYISGGSINQVYASGNVSIGAYVVSLGNGGNVGGLVGTSTANILEAYATGSVTAGAGNSYVGGLVGYLSASLSQTYAAGKVSVGTGTTDVGGLVGDFAGGTISHSLWDTTATGQTVGLGSGTSTGAVGYTTAQMQNYNTYSTVYSGWNFSTTWSPPTQVGQAGQTAAYYPELYALTPVVVANPTSASRTYGAANPTFAGTVIAGGTTRYELGPIGDSLSTGSLFGTTATLTSGVGTYAISDAGGGALSAKGVLYRVITPTSALLTINPAALTLTYTANAAQTVYGSALPTLSGAVTATGLVAGDTLTTATTGTAAWTTTAAQGNSVGSYGITGSGLSAANYTITALQAPGNATALSITPAALTITYTSNVLSQVYGAVTPSLTGSVAASGLVNGDTLTGVTSGVAGWTTPAAATSGVGSYAVNGSGLTANSGNYTFSFAQAAGNATALSITPAALTITYTANAVSRAYGGVNPALTGNVAASGLVNGNTLASVTAGLAGWTTTAGTASNVGSYAITGTGLVGDSANYTYNFVQAASSAKALTVTQAPVTITYSANPVSQVYGAANAALSGSVSASGLVNGNTLTGVTTGTAAWSTTANSTSNVGSYAVTGSGLIANNANYKFTFAQGAGNATDLSITPAPLTVTYTANPVSQVYGAVNPSLSGSFSATGLVNGDTLSGVIGGTAGWTTTAVSTSGAGSYAINGSGLTANSGNYTFNFAQAAGNATALSITPATVLITYTATPTSQTYGSTPTPTGTVSATGLVNTDTLGGVTSGTATWSTPATAASNIGSYAVTGSGLTGATGNYIFNFVQAASNSTAYLVTPAALLLTYTATPVSRLYGAANPTVGGTVVATGLENTDTVASVTTGTATWSTTAKTTNGVGGYAITGTGLAANSADYTISFAQAAGNATALSITPAPLTLTFTATAATKVYGAALPKLTGTVTVSGLVNGDTLSGATANGVATWTTTATSGSGVGSYAITGGGLSAANYTINAVEAANNAKALTITPAALTITYTANTTTRIYGNANPTLSGYVSASGLVNGDTLATVSKGTAAWYTTATTASGVGSYAVDGSGLSANSANYKFTFVDAAVDATALTVTPRALTLTPVAISQTYGSAIPTTDTATAAAKTTTSGLVNGDTVSSISVTTPATSASGVGTYALTGSAAVFSTGSAGNYTITYATNATGLTITAAPLVITYNANPATMTAGSAVPTLSGSVSASGLENGDVLANILAGTGIWTTTATSASAAGSYAITGSGYSGNSANYKFTFVQAPGNATALTVN